MSAQVCLERTKCLLSTLSPPCLHPFLYHPSLPTAGFMSSPGLSSISVTHRPHYWGCSQTGWAADGKGLQDMYMVSAAWTKTCKSDQKKKVVIWVWTSQCLQHVFKNRSEHSARLFLYILLPWVWGSVGWVKLREALELVWPLRT